jgi:LmbE family N-acetylglucosaminyl deacetylase
MVRGPGINGLGERRTAAQAEFFCAGTLARAGCDGAAIGICVLCMGDRGQPAVPIANLTAAWRREMAAAAKLLETVLLRSDFGDGQLFDGKDGEELPITRSAGELFELEEQVAAMVTTVRDDRPSPCTGQDAG